MEREGWDKKGEGQEMGTLFIRSAVVCICSLLMTAFDFLSVFIFHTYITFFRIIT